MPAERRIVRYENTAVNSKPDKRVEHTCKGTTVTLHFHPQTGSLDRWTHPQWRNTGKLSAVEYNPDVCMYASRARPLSKSGHLENGECTRSTQHVNWQTATEELDSNWDAWSGARSLCGLYWDNGNTMNEGREIGRQAPPSPKMVPSCVYAVLLYASRHTYDTAAGSPPQNMTKLVQTFVLIRPSASCKKHKTVPPANLFFYFINSQRIE